MQTRELFSLEGKTALVTGAGRGLGAEIAQGLAAAGAAVACADIAEETARSTASSIQADGGSAIALACDVADESQVQAMVAGTIEQLGGLDVLFNNAGISESPPRMFHEYPSDSWRRMIGVDLDGVFFCAKHALAHMVAQRRGVIVNIASMWGLIGAANVAPMPGYTAAKGGVVNLTREMALQYADAGIRVNAICPGFFRTPLADNIYDDPSFVAAATAATPMGRIADAGEIRGIAVFLASEASSFMTGHNLVVDGGILAQ